MSNSTRRDTASLLDTASFVLPSTPAKAEAVRKLEARITDALSIGPAAAETIAQAVVDPTAVRRDLGSALPGLTATRERNLQVVPARVWTPWVLPAADEIPRYGNRKLTPFNDPSIPPLPGGFELCTPEGFPVHWSSRAARAYHAADNRRLYQSDADAYRMRLFPEKGGIITPLVLIPQIETFGQEGEREPSLRVLDGVRRALAAREVLEDWASAEQLPFEGITPQLVAAVLGRDRSALLELVEALRRLCAREEETPLGYADITAVHYLASAVTLPAYIVVGSSDTRTSEIRPLGAERELDLALGTAISSWHRPGGGARVVAIGQRHLAGLSVPGAQIDDELLATLEDRLAARRVPQRVIDTGYGRIPDTRPALRLAWWCRAIKEVGGNPATAVAGFAAAQEETWPSAISRSVLAVAEELIGDTSIVYPPGDYRARPARPDSLQLLVSDADALTALAAVTADGEGGLLAHPRLHNARHIALAHLALTGTLVEAVRAEGEVPERVALHTALLAKVAECWAAGRAPVFAKPAGGLYRDSDKQPVPIDARTLTRDDLPWPTDPVPVGYLLSSNARGAAGASHLFELRYEVEFTVPHGQIGAYDPEPGLEGVAVAVRRWFPRATGVAFTDPEDREIRGVMVGSVFVEFQEGSRRAPGRPPKTSDVLVLNNRGAVPDGELLRPDGELIGIDEVLEQMLEEFSELSDQAGDELGEVDVYYPRVPVLELPEHRP